MTQTALACFWSEFAQSQRIDNMASTPPKKYPPEFLAENSSSTLLHVAIAFASIEMLVVALFVAARLKIKTANGLDFYLILPSFVVCFSQTIVCFCKFYAFKWLFIFTVGL